MSRGLVAVLLLAALGLAGGCDGCAGESTGGGEVAGLEKLPEQVPLPGDYYLNAYEAALTEINPDNAADELKKIEREIARERRALD